MAMAAGVYGPRMGFRDQTMRARYVESGVESPERYPEYEPRRFSLPPPLWTFAGANSYRNWSGGGRCLEPPGAAQPLTGWER